MTGTPRPPKRRQRAPGGETGTPAGARAPGRVADFRSIAPAAAVVSAAGLMLGWVAFRLHPIGDYFTETDFYGGYAEGARAIREGRWDAARYGLYGPAYEVLLALLAPLARDLFTAGRLLAVLSAVVALASAVAWSRRRWGAAAGVWMAALLAANPSFFRYGYSVGSDMPALAAASLAIAAALGRPGPLGAVAAGAAAGAATLFRYSYASLLPGVLLIALTQVPRGARVRAALGTLAAFAVVVGLFVVPMLGAGHVPGELLVRESRWFLGDAPATELESRYAPGSRDPRPVPPPELAASAARRVATGALASLRNDGALLLGWPVAGVTLAGLAFLIATRQAGGLGPLVLVASFVFLALAPVFYSERYRLVMLPFLLAPAAAGLARAGERGGAVRAAAVIVGLLALGSSMAESVRLQRLIRRSIPTEALAAAASIRARSETGDRVLARKPHVAFHAGREAVLLPTLGTLEELGEFCRRERVKFLYYSWYELRLRRQFGFLLDTTAAVPGLTPIHATEFKPSATYLVGPELGSTPVWWEDGARRDAIARRVNELIAPSIEAMGPWPP